MLRKNHNYLRKKYKYTFKVNEKEQKIIIR